jgi:hypothetical protein
MTKASPAQFAGLREWDQIQVGQRVEQTWCVHGMQQSILDHRVIVEGDHESKRPSWSELRHSLLKGVCTFQGLVGRQSYQVDQCCEKECVTRAQMKRGKYAAPVHL